MRARHDLRWVNINVPGKKHMTIDDYQLKLAAQVAERAAIEYRTSYQDQKRQADRGRRRWLASQCALVVDRCAADARGGIDRLLLHLG